MVSAAGENVGDLVMSGKEALKPTLRKHCGTELDTGATRANSKVADFLFYGICGDTGKPAFKDERAREYLTVNLKGRVPALVTESGTLTETPGLLLFVAQHFPQAELAPLSDPFALARAQEFNSYLCSTVHVAHAHGEARVGRTSPRRSRR